MPYRDVRQPCPGCGAHLGAASFARCSGCGGVWLSEAELQARMQAMRGKSEFNLVPAFEPLDDLPGPDRPDRQERACPMCQAALVPTHLGQVEVDRCRHRHGVWFDPDELAAVLAAATEGAAVHLRDVTLSPAEQRVQEQALRTLPTDDDTSLLSVVLWSLLDD